MRAAIPLVGLLVLASPASGANCEDALDAGEINALMNDTVANAVSAVPEPGALALLAGGLLGLAGFHRMRGGRHAARR